jgi:hypothetical protein
VGNPGSAMTETKSEAWFVQVISKRMRVKNKLSDLVSRKPLQWESAETFR